MKECTVQELAAAMSAGATVIDVREVPEYQEGHVPGAQLIPLSALASRITEVPPAVPLYIICRSGRRSISAGDFLAAQLGTDWINVAGGTLAWLEAGYPVQVGDEVGMYSGTSPVDAEGDTEGGNPVAP